MDLQLTHNESGKTDKVRGHCSSHSTSVRKAEQSGLCKHVGEWSGMETVHMWLMANFPFLKVKLVWCNVSVWLTGLVLASHGHVLLAEGTGWGSASAVKSGMQTTRFYSYVTFSTVVVAMLRSSTSISGVASWNGRVPHVLIVIPMYCIRGSIYYWWRSSCLGFRHLLPHGQQNQSCYQGGLAGFRVRGKRSLSPVEGSVNSLADRMQQIFFAKLTPMLVNDCCPGKGAWAALKWKGCFISGVWRCWPSGAPSFHC